MRLLLVRRLPASASAAATAAYSVSRGCSPAAAAACYSTHGHVIPSGRHHRRRPLVVAAAALPTTMQRGLTTARRREEAEGRQEDGSSSSSDSGSRQRAKAAAAAAPEPERAGEGSGVAIDNTGILDGYQHGGPPTPSQIAMHVRGARLQGGNVVWRAPGAVGADDVTGGSAAAGAGGEAGAGAAAGVGNGVGGFAAPPGAGGDDSNAALWERATATVSLARAKDTRHHHLNEPPDFRSLGVIEPSKDLDLQLMIQNYTVPALAAGLRDREETLQLCARLLADGDLAQLEKVLHPYQAGLITRRRRKTRSLDLQGGLTSSHLNMLRKYLQRSPRHLTRAVSLRASVVIPLCNVDGVASLLFERRSPKVRSFKNQVCFPGGMVEEARDVNIIETSLREMEEEIGFPAKQVDVLGVLRCDWSEVHKITGIGVTPVVGFLGDLTERTLAPNPDEVSECFTVPLSALLKEEHWNDDNENATVVFVGGPHIVWGLTAYICRKFITDILCRYQITC